MRHIPNALSLLRLLCAPFMAWLVISGHFGGALALAVPAALTDWLDGWAARRLGVSSKVGVYLDPAADKTLLVVLFVVLGVSGQIPLWVVGVVLVRDIVIVVGALLLWRLRGVARFTPAISGKVSTFFQIATVLAALLAAALPDAGTLALRDTGLGATSFFAVLSGLEYIRLGIALARRHPAAATFPND